MATPVLTNCQIIENTFLDIRIFFSNSINKVVSFTLREETECISIRSLEEWRWVRDPVSNAIVRVKNLAQRNTSPGSEEILQNGPAPHHNNINEGERETDQAQAPVSDGTRTNQDNTRELPTSSLGNEEGNHNDFQKTTGPDPQRVSQKEEGKEGEECTICLTPLNKRVIKKLSCDHVFHIDCLRKHLEGIREYNQSESCEGLRDENCPNCRKDLNPNEIAEVERRKIDEVVPRRSGRIRARAQSGPRSRERLRSQQRNVTVQTQPRAGRGVVQRERTRPQRRNQNTGAARGVNSPQALNLQNPNRGIIIGALPVEMFAYIPPNQRAAFLYLGQHH